MIADLVIRETSRIAGYGRAHEGAHVRTFAFLCNNGLEAFGSVPLDGLLHLCNIELDLREQLHSALQARHLFFSVPRTVITREHEWIWEFDHGLHKPPVGVCKFHEALVWLVDYQPGAASVMLSASPPLFRLLLVLGLVVPTVFQTGGAEISIQLSHALALCGEPVAEGGKLFLGSHVSREGEG